MVCLRPWKVILIRKTDRPNDVAEYVWPAISNPLFKEHEEQLTTFDLRGIESTILR